jgi:hypothetical protein
LPALAALCAPAILAALAGSACGGRTALDLDEGATAPSDVSDAGDAGDASDALCPPGRIVCYEGCSPSTLVLECQAGQTCVPEPCLPALTTCPAGQQLCATGCPERQDFMPPQCIAGPCPSTLCNVGGGDGGAD